MSFRDVIIKNFKGSMQKYFAYFLCCSFTIMMFFMYSSIMFNKDFMQRDDTEVLRYIFPITIAAIAVFSVFFILYAHASFLKGRNKEFGIYMTLGITEKELIKIILIENIIIDLLAMVVGIAVGALFSRFFQMIILNMLEITNIHFYMSDSPFIVTILAFFLIYTIILLFTAIRMRKIDIGVLLNEARKSEGKGFRMSDLVLGIISLFILGMSVVFVFIISKNNKLNSNPFVLLTYISTAFLGIYLAISHGGNFIIMLLKKSHFYRRNMLAVSEIHYKFNQNKRIIFVLSVLSTVTIFLVASPFSLLNLSEKLAEMNPNHIEYAELAGNNTTDQDRLDSILSKQKVTSNIVVPFLFCSTVENSNDLSTGKTVLSVSQYNAYMKSNIVVNKGQCLNLNLDWKPGNQGVIPGEVFTLYIGENRFDYHVIDSQRGTFVASSGAIPSLSILLINDEDFDIISKSSTDNNWGNLHLINYSNWKSTKPIVNELKAQFNGSKLPVISTITAYEDLKKWYSVFLFVSLAVGILFFVAGGSVLYFKQYTELPETKVTFYKLFKIGITKKEVSKTVGMEIGVVFFVPLVFGSFQGISLIYLTTHIFGGQDVINEFMKNSLFVILIYFISQGIFYLVTKRKYLTEIHNCL